MGTWLRWFKGSFEGAGGKAKTTVFGSVLTYPTVWEQIRCQQPNPRRAGLGNRLKLGIG